MRERTALLRVLVASIIVVWGATVALALEKPRNVLILGDESYELLCCDLVHLCLLVDLADQFDGIGYLDFPAISSFTILILRFSSRNNFLELIVPPAVAVAADDLGDLLLDDRHEAALIRRYFR